MFSVFRSPTLTQRKNIQQNENNIIAKKPGLSHRKPLADRKPNLEPVKKQTAKPKPVLKAKTNEVDVEIDICSYKNVKDNLFDLSIEKDSLGSQGVYNVIRKFTYDDIPTIPKYIEKKYEPEILDDFTNIDDMSTEEITKMFFSGFSNMDRVEMSLPSICFDDE